MDFLKLDVVHIFHTHFLFYVGILYPSGEPGLGWDGLTASTSLQGGLGWGGLQWNTTAAYPVPRIFNDLDS